MLDGTLPDLIALLDVERVDRDTYRGSSPAGRDRRVYGRRLLASVDRGLPLRLDTRCALAARLLRTSRGSLAPILYQVASDATAEMTRVAIRAVQRDATYGDPTPRQPVSIRGSAQAVASVGQEIPMRKRSD